ncbi:MAG: hypothetical protein NC120_08235 [Ruminococcus sp.]|nr:hypothetical protein [Ruminococcus sp.]
MNANSEFIKDICRKAADGQCYPDVFYEKISAAAEEDGTDGDLACLLEDVLMELEMERGGGKRLVKESAERILKELEG